MGNMKTCIDCQESKSSNDFPKYKSKGKSYERNRCRACFNAYCLALPKKESQKEYPTIRQCKTCKTKKNLSEFYLRERGYYRTNCKSCYDKIQSALHAEKKDIYNAINKLRIRELRLQCLEAYGCFCVCCNENHEKFLTFDHVYDDGQAHRKAVGVGAKFYRWIIENDFPDTLQILCYNCNMAKALGGCPHNKEI